MINQEKNFLKFLQFVNYDFLAYPLYSYSEKWPFSDQRSKNNSRTGTEIVTKIFFYVKILRISL